MPQFWHMRPPLGFFLELKSTRLLFLQILSFVLFIFFAYFFFLFFFQPKEKEQCSMLARQYHLNEVGVTRWEFPHPEMVMPSGRGEWEWVGGHS